MVHARATKGSAVIRRQLQDRYGALDKMMGGVEDGHIHATRQGIPDAQCARLTCCPTCLLNRFLWPFPAITKKQ